MVVRNDSRVYIGYTTDLESRSGFCLLVKVFGDAFGISAAVRYIEYTVWSVFVFEGRSRWDDSQLLKTSRHHWKVGARGRLSSATVAGQDFHSRQEYVL